MYKRRKKIIIAGLTALFCVCGCSRTTEESVIAQEVQTLPAVIGDIQTHVTFIGNVAGGQTASLNWGTNGVIGKVYVKLGDPVREGEVLATLETDSLSPEILRAEIPYITAIEELEEVLVSETPKTEAYKDLKDKEGNLEDAEKYRESLKYPRATIGDVKYWSDQVEIYRGFYEAAKETFDDAASWRNSPVRFEYNTYHDRRKAMLDALNEYAEVYNTYLYYSGKASDRDITVAVSDIDVAKSEYETALKVFKTYSSYPREKDLKAAQIKVENAQTTYNNRNILASINGVVTQISMRPGDYVTKGSSAVRLDNTEHLYMPLNVSEIDILAIQDGMRAQIILDSNPSKVYEGRVTKVSEFGESSDNRVTFQTMVEILDPDEMVKIGMTGEVNLITAVKESVLIVPANAVFTEGKNSYVGVYNGIACNDVPVTTGIVSGTVAEITGGFLKRGDLVCVPSVDNQVLNAMGLTQTDAGIFSAAEVH